MLERRAVPHIHLVISFIFIILSDIRRAFDTPKLLHLNTQSVDSAVTPSKEAGNLIDLEDSLITKANVAQAQNVRFSRLCGGKGKDRHVVEHSPVCVTQFSLSVISLHDFDPLWIVYLAEKTFSVVGNSVVAFVVYGDGDGYHLALSQCQIAVAMHEAIVEGHHSS